MSARLGTVARSLPFLWALLCTAAYTTLSLLRFRRFDPTSWDNAIFEQAIRGYAHLGLPIVDIKGPGFNILGDHFSPITALVAPFYRLWPSAQTLLVAQAVLIGVSVLVVSRLAVRHAGPWAGAMLAVAYGISFGISSAVQSDFHEVAFGAPLLALAGSAYIDRRWNAVVGWSLPLLLVKEDMGATVLVIGLVLMLAGERRRGTLLAAAGVVGAALVVLVVLPSVNPGGVYDYASSVGGDRGVVATLLDEPGRKALTVLVTLAVTGLAALGSPWVLLVLPTFAWRFVGDNPYYWGTDWHYSLLLMPIVFVAAVDTMRRYPPRAVDGGARARRVARAAAVDTAVGADPGRDVRGARSRGGRPARGRHGARRRVGRDRHRRHHAPRYGPRRLLARHGRHRPAPRRRAGVRPARPVGRRRLAPGRPHLGRADLRRHVGDRLGRRRLPARPPRLSGCRRSTSGGFRWSSSRRRDEGAGGGRDHCGLSLGVGSR
ncbi:MAG: DUF2079 domain-containing protein [Aeromicrobium erythreum]